jgi:ABC-type bacteriocin/lantibiotic exporter with double-glycine peptidase domain
MQISKAVESANISSFIERMPGGLKYIIEEIGKNISGGEQQRICLARTFIRNADLLILDEPTSALDENNERLLVNNILNYLEQNNPIFIVVTHRKEVLNICNKVIYYKSGKVHFLDLSNQEQRNRLDEWIRDDGEEE